MDDGLLLADIDGEWMLLERYVPPPPPPPPLPRRVQGTGSMYKRGDGLWAARVEFPRRPDGSRNTKMVTSLKFCAMLKKFTAIEKPTGFDVTRRRVPVTTTYIRRRGHMYEARELGTHTGREWFHQKQRQGFRCYYCGDHCPLTKDHMTPVSRGGSDAIDNIVAACKRCNCEKNSLTAEEYLENRICWYETTNKR